MKRSTLFKKLLVEILFQKCLQRFLVVENLTGLSVRGTGSLQINKINDRETKRRMSQLLRALLENKLRMASDVERKHKTGQTKGL